ncbi:VOC family protein [Nonomuraea pusilla]|uniref:Glyoxalase-like domain-containing protein n=1 Tax=Nonomuraea pusilla TaxID=46177 RepID=A0A1H8FXT4_9ACTN|nr:VOC family protein [Nonomuraea pusilla]SEN36047.1 Glyoxalase-like domain-containing protein [Nonomuraea pusilla]
MSETPFRKIDTVFVRCDDPHAVAGWYQEVLGWPEAWRTEHIVVLTPPEGPPVTLLDPGDGDWSGFNFYAPDAAAARQWLLDRQVEVGPLNQAPDQPVTWFWFRDPEGNRLEVCSY